MQFSKFKMCTVCWGEHNVCDVNPVLAILKMASSTEEVISDESGLSFSLEESFDEEASSESEIGDHSGYQCEPEYSNEELIIY